MSDPADGEEPRDIDGPGEASDEDVRAAVSDIDGDHGPQEAPEPRDTVPEGDVADPTDDDSTTEGLDPIDGEPPAAGDDAGEADTVDRAVGPDTDGRTDTPADAPAATDEPPGTEPELREGDLSAPASATEGDHTLLEEYEREQEPAWKSYARTGAFWLGATLGSVALTTTAFVSLVESGLSQPIAFFIASVALAVVVGFVFLSLQRE